MFGPRHRGHAVNWQRLAQHVRPERSAKGIISRWSGGITCMRTCFSLSLASCLALSQLQSTTNHKVLVVTPPRLCVRPITLSAGTLCKKGRGLSKAAGPAMPGAEGE